METEGREQREKENGKIKINMVEQDDEEGEKELPEWMREYGDEDNTAVGTIQRALRCRQGRVNLKALRAEEAKRPQNVRYLFKCSPRKCFLFVGNFFSVKKLLRRAEVGLHNPLVMPSQHSPHKHNLVVILL